MIYNHWIHEIVNKGEADKYIILQYPDLVQLLIIHPDGKTEKDRILERDKAKEEIKKYPNAFDFEEIDVKELIINDIKQSISVKKKLNKNKNRDIKINNKDIKKVVSLLDRKNELSTEIAANELKFDIKKIELIFQTLIENNDVIDLSSKTGISIAKKRISSYKSLTSKNINIKPNKLFKFLNLLWKIVAGIILVLGGIAAIIQIRQYRENGVPTKEDNLRQDKYEQKNENASRIDSTYLENDTLKIQ